MVKVYDVDTLNISQDIVYMPIYMVNVPHDMLKAYMAMVNVPQDMANVPQDMVRGYVDMENVSMDISYVMFKVPRTWYIYAPRHDKLNPDIVKDLHAC
jgi:hypothetical protein